MVSSQHDHEADLEAVAPLPEEGASPAAIDKDERPRSFLGGRKKAVAAAVVGIVVAAAIAVGVAMSVGGGRSAEPDRAGVAQNNNGDQDVAVVIVGDPSEESSTNADDGEAASQQQEPLDGELPVGGAVDPYDESLDVILTASHSAEYPDDLIYDGGYEQREPEEYEAMDGEELAASVEKVEFNSEDTTIELAQFDGPITDFIVTQDLARFTISADGICPNSNEAVWRMELITDNYPWETSWSMKDSQGKVVAAGPPQGRNYARSTEYNGRMCVKTGQYTLTMNDLSSDGICCKYGKGQMQMSVNGNVLAKLDPSDDEAFGTKTWNFRVAAQQGGTPTPRPSPKPTPRPATGPAPNPQPTPNGQNSIQVKVVTDRFAGETGYKLTSPTGRVLINRPRGSLENSKTYVDTKLVPAGEYVFEIEDAFMGLEKPGLYSVSLDGEELVYGSTWDTRNGNTKTYTIKSGYEPPLTAQEKKWLDGHNRRRAEFHTANGKEPRLLVWSPLLAEESDRWIDEIAPTCKIVREENLEYGENLSARSSLGQRDEGPEEILARWAEKKVALGYPSNQSATQIYWYATRYVGCADRVVAKPNGTICYVSICRYSRPGNCSMGRYDDWKVPTLANRSECTPSCPNNVCY